MPGPVRVEALAHFPIERDLVVDRRRLRQQAREHQALHHPEGAAHAGRRANTCRRRSSCEQFEQFSSCINCMLCYAACPQFGLNPKFTGPGVLALLHRYNADSRDGGAGRAHGAGERRRGRLELHRGRLLLRGLPQGRRSGQCGQPEQDQQREGLLPPLPRAEGEQDK